MPYIRLPDGTWKKVNDGAPVDSTLKISGAAADAKAVGNKISEIVADADVKVATALNEAKAYTDGKVEEVNALIETKLPSPEAATVGQFIKASAVDESGKVTATEAVDEPDEDDALELVAELGLAEPMTDVEGNILTDENGVLFLL